MSEHPESIIQYSPIERLPVEILNRICDYLDTYSLLYSLRNTSRRLRTVINQYQNINLDFRSLSECHFRRIRHALHPKNVRSLTISDKSNNDISSDLLIKCFRKKIFTQIRHMTVSDIRESKLRNILKRFNISSLVSFKLKFTQLDNHPSNPTAALISSILARADLRHLELDLRVGRIEKIMWYKVSSIEYLSLGPLTNFIVIYNVLSHCPYVKVLKCSFQTSSIPKFVINQTNSTNFTQVTSLTLNHIRSNIDDLELLLSLLPSLSYLKIIAIGHLFNGNRWQNFIENNLPLLKQFEFLFVNRVQTQESTPDIQLIIEPFLTTFWIETKKWFITCEYEVQNPERVFLYSIPVCIPIESLRF